MVRESGRDEERWLLPGEEVVARCTRARLDRRLHGIADEPPSGELYVTSERLVLAGAIPLAIALDDIEEAGLLGDDLVLLLRGGGGATIQCNRSRLLRADIAAARAARRSAAAAQDLSGLRGSGLLPRPGS